MVPREVVLGLDIFEFRISIFAAVMALVLAILNLIEWIRNSPITNTAKYDAAKGCPTGYHHFGTQCLQTLTSVRGRWAFQFFLIFIAALLIFFFAWRRKRYGVVFASLVLGLLGSAGLVFLFLGAYLLVRAYRLQKYGDASFFGSNRVARERGQARRSGAPNPATPDRGASAPTPSKRYTPKQAKPKRK